ncbi:MAG: hypothetical protein IT378_07620 [Sandaracinaceae bacterium]|nr:hypothetical protein [Sandaracinaceae bacterium]
MPAREEWRRARAALGEAPGALIALALVLLPIGLLLSAALVGLWVLAWGYGRACTVLLTGATGRPAVHRYRAGALVLFGSGLVAAPVLAARVIGAEHGLLWRLIAPPLAGALVGAVLAGWAFAPLCASEQTPAGLVRSFELAVQGGFRNALALAAGLGATAGALVVVASEIAGWWLGVPVIFIALPLLGGALVAGRYAVLGARAPSTEVRASLRASAVLLVPSLLAFGMAAASAALTPAPMRPGVATRGVWHDGGEQVWLQGTTVSARVVPGGVEVAAEDGGGAGLVPSDRPGTMVRAWREGDHFRIELGGDEVRYTLVDRDGVRLDDGLDRRVLERLGIAGQAACGWGALLLAVFALYAGVRIGRAQALDAPPLAGGAGAGPWALEGVRRPGGQGPRVEGRPLLLEDASFESASLRIRMPARARLLAGPEQVGRDNVPAVVVSRFEGVLRAGFRESASPPLPSDAWIVLGTLEQARAAMVGRAVRHAAWIALGAATAWIAGAVLLVASLLA